jgi:error-prone DNA polymerase
MLTAIQKCFDLIERHYGRQLTLANVPAEDSVVYDMVCKADTIGVFQIESRAQMAMLPRLKPRKFYDLVIEVAIVRPGPLQGGMVHPYLRRRAGEEAVDYPDERVRKVLEKTLGVPIFQEQAMRLAIVAAGFTPGEADQLRRAMGAWRRPGIIDQFRQKLLEGMLAQGYPVEFAERLFQQIRGFGEYGFPESHAASFASLVYVSAWLKRYYPAAFTAALLNSQPMGFYAPAQLVGDARRHAVEVFPADVNFSDWETTLEAGRATGANGEWAVRLGLRLIAGLSQAQAAPLVEARRGGAFCSVDDVARRARLSSSVLVRLSRADAFRSLQLERRGALWNSLPEQLSQGQKSPGLFDDVSVEEPAVELPPLSPLEEVTADYATAGLSLRDHPLKFARSRLEAEQVTTSRDLLAVAHGRRVLVAGLVLFRQRPATARGLTFVTLEDETGVVNLIVLPEIWERYRRIARGAQGLIAAGRVQRRDEIIHVMVDRLRDLGALLAGARVRSRDFR